MTTRRIRFVPLLAAALACFALPCRAQETGGDEVDPAELMRQIRRNLMKIEDELHRVRSAAAGEASESVRKDMDKLAETLKRRQEQVTKDIDEIVKQLKASQSGSGSGSSQSQSQSKGGKSSQSKSGGSQSKDRNKSEGGKRNPGQDGKEGEKPEGSEDGDGKEKKKPDGGKPEQGDAKGGKEPQGGKEDNARKGGPGENRPGPNPADPKARRVTHAQLNEIWGRLPKEQRQKLTDRNFEDFTPEYEEEIKEYLRRTNVVDK